MQFQVFVIFSQLFLLKLVNQYIVFFLPKESDEKHDSISKFHNLKICHEKHENEMNMLCHAEVY